MSRPNISPGPWLKSGHKVFALTPYTGPDARMKRRLPDGINRFSCQVQQDNSEASGGAPAQEIEANTQAIAALPDLLDALEKLLVCPDLQFDAMEPESLEAMAAAKAALTKAGYTL